MKSRTKQILKILHVLSWIIFIGVCIEAGGSIFSAFYTLVINSFNAKTFWVGNDLSALYAYDRGHFFAVTLLISIASVLKACIFYRIIKILHDKKLNMSQPFSNEMRRFIITICCLAFGIGLFTAGGANYTDWLVKQGINMPDTQHLRLGGADVWFFMSVTLFVIAQIFKRGIEIQTENELTV
jgi:TRAP-type C4-dicarboxylate transport system permease small subunit